MTLDFLKDAPSGAPRVLQILANAESLTDKVAQDIIDLAPIEGTSSELFVRALHYADFVEPRNSEWSFDPQVRQELLTLAAAEPELVREAHRTLLRLGKAGDKSLAGSAIPAYLFTKAGQAYHSAAVGDTAEALSLYADVARGPFTGVQWLASNLAEEQERRRILPPGSIETTFLRARVLFREGKLRQAEPLFRRIAEIDENRFEVAVSLGILGNLVGRSSRREAESFLRRSIEINEELDDLRGLAQMLHSLANLLARDPQRAKEAEELYLHSIDLLERAKDWNGVAQTLHSFANLLTRDPQRAKEAEELYVRSIEIGERSGNEHDVAQRLHSLANLLARDPRRPKEAEERYLHSIAIGEKIGNEHHIAQTLHSLANLLTRDPQRAKEAEQRYLRAIDLLERAKDWNGVAQTLRSFSFLVESRSPREAESLLQRSLELNKQINNRRGQRIVKDSLRSLRSRRTL
jgi:tetratricopeptide (TPR) repeat protein